MGKTRIDVKHLLEDIRDSYPYPIEEAIITELIANALDSGASNICFFTDQNNKTMWIVDDGIGMTSQGLEQYHDIASTGKIKGQGIGFAGLGAKLSLLIAEEIITETKNDSLHKSTRWKLENDFDAIWKYIENQGLVDSPSGKAVLIKPYSLDSDLLKSDYIEYTIRKHFTPFLYENLALLLSLFVYEREISFSINKIKTQLNEPDNISKIEYLPLKIKKKGFIDGFGFVARGEKKFSEEERGIAISTYGKIIKRGWDWIDIYPQNPEYITGIFEVKELSDIITTNKADFLTDVNSKQKFYRYRKYIQNEIMPILQEFGEVKLPKASENELKPLEKELEKVLEDIITDFPELSMLLEKQKLEKTKGIIPDPNAEAVGTKSNGIDIMKGDKGGNEIGLGINIAEGDKSGEKIEKNDSKEERGVQYENRGKRMRPGLMLGFDDDPDRDELGWFVGNTIWINRGHPAYKKSERLKADKYHEIFTVACVLSNYLEDEKTPQVFINRFLSSWGKLS